MGYNSAFWAFIFASTASYQMKIGFLLCSARISSGDIVVTLTRSKRRLTLFNVSSGHVNLIATRFLIIICGESCHALANLDIRTSGLAISTGHLPEPELVQKLVF